MAPFTGLHGPEKIKPKQSTNQNGKAFSQEGPSIILSLRFLSPVCFLHVKGLHTIYCDKRQGKIQYMVGKGNMVFLIGQLEREKVICKEWDGIKVMRSNPSSRSF